MLDGFNPHPSRRTGATDKKHMVLEEIPEVSILTRPEGRVQPASGGGMLSASSFQSSPVPKDGCNIHTSLLPISL